MCWTCTCWCSNDSPDPWKMKNTSEILCVQSWHDNITCPQKQSKDLPRCQFSTEAGGDQLTAASTTDTQYLQASNCSWTNGTSRATVAGSALTRSIKPRTTDPSVPQFPTPSWPNPLSRSVWTCRAEPPATKMLSRRHTTLALAPLTSLDYSLTTWTTRHNEQLWKHFELNSEYIEVYFPLSQKSYHAFVQDH